MLSLAFAAMLFAAPAGTVTVEFSGLTPDTGHVMVQLCDAREYVNFNCRYRQAVAVRGTTATAVFNNIPAGRYAVTSFQDINDDQKMARNLMGMPEEPWGFSGRPEFMMGPPSFDSVAVDVPAGGTTLNIRMQK